MPASAFFIVPNTQHADFGVAPEGAELIDIRADAPFKGSTVSQLALEELCRLNRRWCWSIGNDGVRANLDGANLDGASLVRARLDPIRDDLYGVLSRTPAEVPALLAALREGKVDGSTYSGECACLVGTIANARGCDYTGIAGLAPNAERPIERWFLAIRPGLPVDHPVVAITIGWVEAWLAAREAK